MDKLDFSEFFHTKAQAADFAARLATISESIYQTSFNFEKALTETFGMDKKDKFLALIRTNNIAISSVDALKAFLTKTQADIATLPTLPITLAFEPQDQTLKVLSDWFALNVKRQVLFDIKVDHSLVAGAAMTFNGKFLDFSVKPKFDEILKNIMHPATQPASVQHQDLSTMHVGR